MCRVNELELLMHSAPHSRSGFAFLAALMIPFSTGCLGVCLLLLHQRLGNGTLTLRRHSDFG